MTILTHCAAPSGTGQLTLCGASGEVAVPRRSDLINCPICLESMSTPVPEQLELPGIPENPNAHYDAGGIPVIDVIRAKLTTEQFKGYLLGNSIKYSLRLNHKGSPEGDAYKLADYSIWLREAVTLEKKA